MLSDPPCGELVNTCAGDSAGILQRRESSASPCSTWPVVLIQLSMKAACICATAGPTIR